MSRRRRQQAPRGLRPVKQYVFIAMILVLATAIVWAIGPYLWMFSGNTDLAQGARQGLAAESREHVGSRFLTGMAVGAGLTLIWIVRDLIMAKKPRPKRA